MYIYIYIYIYIYVCVYIDVYRYVNFPLILNQLYLVSRCYLILVIVIRIL